MERALLFRHHSFSSMDVRSIPSSFSGEMFEQMQTESTCFQPAAHCVFPLAAAWATWLHYALPSLLLSVQGTLSFHATQLLILVTDLSKPVQAASPPQRWAHGTQRTWGDPVGWGPGPQRPPQAGPAVSRPVWPSGAPGWSDT